ncbi:MAG: outer membrane protein assembly factor BamA [Bacteroidetes bacterium]|nr:MAG: outer membrane protein assembly factor BamA [Bacteroidota bacterium]
MKSTLFSLLFLACLALLSPAQAQRLGNNKNPVIAPRDQDINEKKGETENKYLNPKKFEIAEITVTGVKYLDAGALISMSGLRVGDKITVPGDAITSAIRKLWKQGILADVSIETTKIEGEKIFLNLDLKERPKLTRFNFTGIRKGERETVKNKIDLIVGRIVTETLLKNTRVAISKYYQEKGFLNTKVDIAQVEDTVLANSVLLNIAVDKGEKVKIKTIAIEGNTEFEDKKIRRKLKKTKMQRIMRIFVASKFIRNKYEEDKDGLIKFYNAQGYRDARIVSDSVYRVNDKYIGLNINLEEGKKYYFRNITWKGNYLYTNEVLDRILKIKKGDIYDKENLEKRLSFSQTDLDITSLYMDDGYLFFNVTPVEIGIENDSVDVEIQIMEGTQANINRIKLTGNTKTSDKVVLREIRTIPGRKFSRQDLIRSQREIQTLNYFDQEQIGLNPVPNPEDGTVDIEYSVVEKPSDQIELSGGWGGFFGFVGTLGLTFNNFSARKIFKYKDWNGVLPSGDGQRLSLRFQANGRIFQTYTLAFTEPWLGGRKPHSFTVSLNHSVQRQTDRFNEVQGSLLVTGASVSLGRRLQWPDNFFTISNSLAFNRYELKNYQGFGAQIFTGGTGTSRTVSLNTTISRNSIDNPTFPKSGSSLTLSVSLTPPYSLFNKGTDYKTLPDNERYRWIEYHKWMFDGSWFTNLFDKFVLHTRAHIGYLGQYSQRVGVGPFERFVLGGAGLTGQNFLLGTEIIGLRGYRDNSVTPPYTNGGVVYNKFVMELRYPISTNPAATIFGLVFADAGNNFGSYAEYNPFNLKRSVGVGARIFMPAFGLIGLDWGYGFDQIPNPNNSSQRLNGAQFHFTIGQQFR